MGEISIKGILAGLFSYLIIIVVASIVGVILLASSLMSSITSGVNPAEIINNISHDLDVQNSVFIILGLIIVIEIIVSIYSGYIAAKVSGTGFYINAGIVGIIIVGAWLLFYTRSIELSGLWLTFSSIPATLLGGYLVQRKINSEMKVT